MELRQLRAFELLVRRGSFTRVARELGLSQPAVSTQIRTLEEELGVKLLERLPRQVLLTPAGEVLLEYAQRLINLEEEARLALADLAGLQSGCLRVGASSIIGTYLLPEILGEFKRRHPGLRIITSIGPSQRVVDSLQAHAIDVGLVEAAHPWGDLAAETFCEDELVLIVSSRHPWADRPSVRPEELAGQPYVAGEPESGTRAQVEAGLQSVGIKVVPTLELGGMEAIKNSVIAGLGVAFISRHAIRFEADNGLLVAVPVEGLALRRSFYSLYHSDGYMSSSLQALLKLVREAVPSA